MAVSLLNMTNDEATVAENVTTYKREDVEKQFAAISAQMKKDQDRLPKLQREIEEINQRLETNSYTLELFSALIDAFNRDYPRQEVKDEPAAPKVDFGTVEKEAEKEPVLKEVPVQQEPEDASVEEEQVEQSEGEAGSEE
ncbi:MAG: hypothetical protein NC218_01365 [Acetobacter sp.]|nr:hypothetical protein [Acetobacter sp.]